MYWNFWLGEAAPDDDEVDWLVRACLGLNQGLCVARGKADCISPWGHELLTTNKADASKTQFMFLIFANL